MLIVDDALFLRALMGETDWIDDGEVVTTYTYQFRALQAAEKDEAEGVMSRLVHRVSGEDLERLRNRVRYPIAPLLVLDPRTSINAAVAVRDTFTLNHLQAELVGAAVHHGAAITAAAISPHVQIACDALGIALSIRA